MVNNYGFNSHLMKACLVAVFAIGLAACSSSDSPSDDDMTDMDMSATDLAAERTDISVKITAANTAVNGLTDDASDAAIDAAEMAVGAAKRAVANSSVPDEEKAAFNTAISAIEGSLGVKKTSITAAREDADAAMKKAMAATGKAMHAALTADPLNLLAATGADTITDAGTLDLGVGSATGAVEPPAMMAGASVGSLGAWEGTSYSHTDSGTKVVNSAVVYTNRGAPTSEPFDDAHDLDTGEDFLTVNTAAEYALVMAAAFTHSGTQNHPVPDKSDAVYVRGTYDGAPGEYRCETGCSSRNDGMGSPTALVGTWTFTPDDGAMVSQPDANYLYFGWWLRKDKDGMPTAASAFHGVEGTVAQAVTLGAAEMEGSATYAGKAAGKFALSNPLEGTGDAGHFTADALLKATFGDGAGAGITGMIDNFMANDKSVPWSVELQSAEWGSAGAFATATTDVDTTEDNETLGTVWSIDGNSAQESGRWGGQMYDEASSGDDDDGSNIPTTVTGTFQSEFSSLGRMVGAFGANKQ